MRMPFGKFRGEYIQDLPDGYLRWLSESIELRNPLRDLIFDELRLRGGEAWHESDDTVLIKIDPGDADLLREVFERGFKAAAKANHPDTGGDQDGMVRLNTVGRSIRTQLDSVGGR